MHRKLVLPILGALVLALAAGPAQAQVPAAVLKAEQDRVDAVKKVKPSVVAVFARGGQGGGTGVLISDDGYALTNFHVVQPTGPTMQCGLPDGVLYDAVLVGLDKVGDVALIKLLPKKEGEKFPFAVLGDSDTVREGDWCFAMGNPFLLATDFTPTITFGLVSGVHRYQYPAGVLLEYTDCIQIDTSINPGNSGGPLFNIKGDLIGINGRGSFDKRGRINSGVGYAISINQIKNFMGHLRAGLDSDHASLGALVTTQTGDKASLTRLTITSILEDSDVARRGLELEDEMLSFAGRSITSVNHYKNVLGLYPRGWRVPMEFRHEGQRKEVLVRLMGMQRKLIVEDDKKDGPKDGPPPKIDPKQPKIDPKIIQPKGPPSPAAKFYEPKPGFANHYFNKLERDRLMDAFRKHGEFTTVGGKWTMEGTIRFKKLRTEDPVKIEIAEETPKDAKAATPVVRMKVKDFDYDPFEPLKTGQIAAKLREPPGSGGFFLAMHLYHKLLTEGEKAVGVEFLHGGYEPLYPPVADGRTESLGSTRVDCEVANIKYLGPFLVKAFFARSDLKLAGFEVRLQDNEDPCEVFLSDYRAVNGRQLPHRIQVSYADGNYATFTLEKYTMAAK